MESKKMIQGLGNYQGVALELTQPSRFRLGASNDVGPSMFWNVRSSVQTQFGGERLGHLKAWLVGAGRM